MKEKSKARLCLELFLSCFKIGAFTIGGGYAMIALFENEFVQNKKWITKDEFLDITAIAESTPGPLAINGATYIGYKTAGIWGSITATLGMVIPSLAIIYIISLFFDKFLELKIVTYAFKGIQAAVIYLILSAGIKMLKSLDKSAFNYVLFSLVFVAILLLTLFGIGFSSIYFILSCGSVGVIAYLLSRKKGGDKK